MTKVSSLGRLGRPTLPEFQKPCNLSNQRPRSYDILVFVRLFLSGRVVRLVRIIRWSYGAVRCGLGESVSHRKMSRLSFFLSWKRVGVRISIYGLGYCTHFCFGTVVLQKSNKSKTRKTVAAASGDDISTGRHLQLACINHLAVVWCLDASSCIVFSTTECKPEALGQ
jgi:hypothetical protein